MAPATTAPPDLARAHIRLTRLATFDQPLGLAVRRGDPSLYVVEKGGRVVAFRGGRKTTVLDISGQVSGGSEQGLLGLAFSPSGDKMYVYFTDARGTGAAGDDVLREYAFSSGRAVPSTARDILRIPDPYPNHNGGNLAFGPDGYLYLGTGDGGSEGDPQNRAQNLDSPFGKMLRLDPTPSGSKPYTVPPTNPYAASPKTRALVWASGLRNPWRWSFDRVTHDLWIGDVGQDEWEEIDVAPSGTGAGDNYGWSVFEASHPYKGTVAPPRYRGPVYEYSHAGGNCAVTGGYVYRGFRIRDLGGAYVFADYCVGRLRAFVLRAGGATGGRFLGPQVEELASFGEDAAGELYVLSLSGGLYRVDPSSP